MKEVKEVEGVEGVKEAEENDTKVIGLNSFQKKNLLIFKSLQTPPRSVLVNVSVLLIFSSSFTIPSNFKNISGLSCKIL